MKIVVVCTGNICRSPAMEFLLDQALDDSVQVTSAGTSGMPSWPVSPPMADLLMQSAVAPAETTGSVGRGALRLETTGTFPHSAARSEATQSAESAFNRRLTAFRSRRLTEQIINDADLILTATSDHRSEVLNLNPLALKRTMSLGELARLSRLVDKTAWAGAKNDAERLKILVPLAMSARSASDKDDITDPYGQGAEVYQQSLNQITTHITALTTALHS